MSGLAPSTVDFEVLASNAAGTGPASTIITGSTIALPTQVPGQVTGLVASGPTASSVSLAWSAPATGGAVASCTVQFRITGAGSWTTAATGVVVATYVVTGLVAATVYDFQVLAVNVVGSGIASATANATTLLALPGLPTALAAVRNRHHHAADLGGAGVGWCGRNLFGAVVSGRCEHLDGDGGHRRRIDHHHRLSLSTSYDFEVSAVNAAGRVPGPRR